MSLPPATRGAAGAADFDVARLLAYLRGRLSGLGSELAATRFQGGQSNPTYLLESGGLRWVLRRRPPGKLLPSAHRIDREFRVLAALERAGFPVPRPRLHCEDEEVLGTAFYVMDFLDGRILRNAAMPGVPLADRAAHYDAMNDTLARLHRVDFVEAGLSDHGKPGDYFARQIDRWSRQYRAALEARPAPPRLPAMDFLIEELPRRVPEDRSTSLVHGDYRVDNLVFDRGGPRVIGVLDWELSTLGHPLADLAYNCLAFRLPPGELVLSGIAGQEPRALGIPTEDEYVARYCERTGRPGIPQWGFYLAFSLFRMAAIAHGIAARALQGNASGGDAVRVGALAGGLAEKGRALLAG